MMARLHTLLKHGPRKIQGLFIDFQKTSLFGFLGGKNIASSFMLVYVYVFQLWEWDVNRLFLVTAAVTCRNLIFIVHKHF